VAYAGVACAVQIRRQDPGSARIRVADGRGTQIRRVLTVTRHTKGDQSLPRPAVVLRSPEAASKKLPSRGQVAVHGTINGVEFQTVLEPDGNSGHWMRVDDALQHAAGLSAADTATLDIGATKDWPEPNVPKDLAAALAAAPQNIQDLWNQTTPMAR
jgi:hypothetical protein